MGHVERGHVIMRFFYIQRTKSHYIVLLIFLHYKWRLKLRLFVFSIKSILSVMGNVGVCGRIVVESPLSKEKHFLKQDESF